MPGPRVEPQTNECPLDVLIKQYTTAPPTAIMMNQTHADIHQMVSKPVGISHVYAIIHFKQSMGGVDRVYQNVGNACRIGSKKWWWPMLLYCTS